MDFLHFWLIKTWPLHGIGKTTVDIHNTTNRNKTFMSPQNEETMYNSPYYGSNGK